MLNLAAPLASAALALVLLTAPACESTDTATDAGNDAGNDAVVVDLVTDLPGDTAEPPHPLAIELAGSIRVLEERWSGSEAGASRVEAWLWQAPVPTTQEVTAEEGDCKLLVGALTDPWNCTPECTWGETLCVDGTCVPYPAPVSAGVLTLAGLSEPVSLAPLADKRYPAVYELPADVFDAGTIVHVTSPGADLPALDLTARGVAPLEADVPTLVPGQPLVLTWTVPTQVVPGAHILLQLMTGWHGSPNLTTIWCETADDGELTVPASLTAEFPIPSCGECEISYLSRFTRDVVDFGQGPIELFVGSRINFVAWW